MTQHGAYRPYILGITLTALLVILQGCNTLPTEPSPSAQIFHANQGLQEWQLSGKIGIKTQHGADSAYLNWLHCGTDFIIRLNGPLGTGAAKLVGNSQQVTLFVSGEEPITAANAEQLLWQQFGWQLPVSQLRYWVKGIPSPQHAYQYQPQGFSQTGWSLSFPRQTQLEQYILPAKAIAQTDELRVTLILREWELQPDCQADTENYTATLLP